ncbi:MAG TPA: BTAD domain-containing putative transcriptional regulator, partial [Anaerolineales bacterium]
MLEIRLLGGFDVRSDGNSVRIPSRPAQALFAYLTLNPGIAHRREKLAGLLWPESTEESARDYLRHALWRIRKSFPSQTNFLVADEMAISLDLPKDARIDTRSIENLGESAAAAELEAALGAYQGELLPGFYEEWIVLEREHLQAVYEHNMARLMALLHGEGRWQEILEWGERWVSLGQKPEPAYRALMSAHAALGEMSKVAATYERCEKALHEF